MKSDLSAIHYVIYHFTIMCRKKNTKLQNRYYWNGSALSRGILFVSLFRGTWSFGMYDHRLKFLVTYYSQFFGVLCVPSLVIISPETPHHPEVYPPLEITLQEPVLCKIGLNLAHTSENFTCLLYLQFFVQNLIKCASPLYFSIV